MTMWRVVITDTERETGIAPVCESEDKHPGKGGLARVAVYDCCRGPHIECWDEMIALTTAMNLTAVDAEVCS